MNEIEYQTPRDKRTPITEAASALMGAWTFYVELVKKLKSEIASFDFEGAADPESHFASQVFGAAWDSPETDGDTAVEKIGLSLDGTPDPNGHAPYALLQVMEVIVAYAVQAMKAEKDEQHDLAWTYVADARYWSGILTAEWTGRQYGEKPGAVLAGKRHAENYAMRDEALKYWRDKIDPSLPASQAANELIRVVPLSHKKLAEIVSAAKKKLT